MQKSFIAILAIFLFIASCKTDKVSKSVEPVLFSINNEPVSSSEFLYVYSKNNFNNDSAKSREEIIKYLDLYINFKLKVKEAEDEGHHLTQAYKNEFETYRKQLAKPYLTETSVTEKLVREAYERMQEEVNASHILIAVSSDASPRDTLNAYNKIIDLREKALAGESFEKLAKEYSQDPSAKTNGGNLGYFTALQMVYPFEDAAYKTPVGKISEPVRTRFGYHLIKVTDKRKSQGRVKVSHIMVRATEGIPAEDSVAARKKIFEIHQKLKAGANWDELVNQFSDDISSKSSGGALPWFGTGNMIPSFENAAFALAQQGEFSEPVKTPYGWHIIKLDEKQGLEPFEEMEASIKSKVSRDSRSELNKIMFIKRLKHENGFNENSESLELALSKADTSLVNGRFLFNENEKLLKKVLFTIGKEDYFIQDFFNFILKNQRKVMVSPEQYMRSLYASYVDESLIQYEEAHLSDKYEDYKMLVQEYRDGILLFQMMDEKVWTKALNDTLGLQSYFEANKDNYIWKTRADAIILNGENKNIVQEAYEFIKRSGGLIPVDGAPKVVSFNKEDHTFSPESEDALKEIIARLHDDRSLVARISLYKESKNVQQQLANIIQYFQLRGIDKSRIYSNYEASEENVAFVSLFNNLKKSVEKKFNLKSALTLQVDHGLFEQGQHPVLQNINWKVGEYSFVKDGRHYQVIIDSILPATHKDLNEVKGLAISDFQNYLEKQWIERLRKKYSVWINDKELEKLIKKIENQ